jgi:hypothetical protein
MVVAMAWKSMSMAFAGKLAHLNKLARPPKPSRQESCLGITLRRRWRIDLLPAAFSRFVKEER